MDRIEWTQSDDSVRDYESEQARAVELASNPILDRLVQKIVLPNEIKEVHVPNAEAVISKVVEVAQNNHTIERILERKHEVKDFASSKTQLAQNANLLGEILNQREQDHQVIPYTVRAQEQLKSTAGIHAFLRSNTLYAQAVKYGFASATLALIIAIALVSTLR